MIYVNQAQKPLPSLIKRPFSQPRSQQILTRNQQLLKKSADDLRIKIKNYSQKDYCNLILFGPTGSGKSSLIHTFHKVLQVDLPTNLCIKDLLHNEGTQHYSNFTLQRRHTVNVQSNRNQIKMKTCEINLIDTRGQLLLNENENKQLELMLEGKIKNMSMVQQRNYRYAYKLWEFWKQETELFPQEIICNTSLLPTQVLLIFDGSLDQVPNGSEEVEFYQNVIGQLRQKGYPTPFIVLTQLDKLEKKMKFLCESDQKQLIDDRIQSIVNKLKVPRNSVFFLENYHGQQQSTEVDYYALKLLYESLQQSHQQIQNQECLLF